MASHPTHAWRTTLATGSPGLSPEDALPVVVDVEPRLHAGRAEGRPIPVGITEATIVRRQIAHLLGDDRAAVLTGRSQPNKASFYNKRRGSILAHEALHCL